MTAHAPEREVGGGTADEITVANPATGAVVGHVPDLPASEVAGLVARARRVQPAWAALGFEGRAVVLRAMRRWLMDNRDRVLETVIEEGGKTYEDAHLGELVYNADALGFWAKRAKRYLADERTRPHSPFLIGRTLVHRHVPFGVVGVIGPWNYPITNNFGDCIPALMAGNAVVLKPSDQTPLTSLLMAEGMRAAGCPEDVFSVATGRADTGRAVVDLVDMVHFTGSTATGRKVLIQAAEKLTPVTLELGGKDPMIVLADADLERAANAAVYYGMGNSGQTCISIERVYVEDIAYEPFVAKVVEKTRQLRQGVPGGPAQVEVGAMTFPPQVDVVEGHVEDALERGATVAIGGHRRPGAGSFFEPTVLTGVDHSMECMTDETFGPTLPIMRVRDEEEAVRLANDSRYGLDASVWTKDAAKGERIARRIESGAVCVNDALVNYLALEVPFGGTKESGIGTRHGAGGIRKYCRTQSVMLTRFAPSREAHFFPYTKRRSALLGRFVNLIYARRLR